MISLFSNIRFYVLVSSFLLSLIESFGAAYFYPDMDKRIDIITPLFAYMAVFYLYITLLIGPATKLFLWLPYRGGLVKARRALGVSTLYFALLHGAFGFFIHTGGFAALPLLSPMYAFGLLLGFITLCIFTVMGMTSFDFMIRFMTFPKWKFLHRFVYLAGILVLIHAMLIGEHYIVLLWVKLLVFGLTAFLICLHIVGLWKKYHPTKLLSPMQ